MQPSLLNTHLPLMDLMRRAVGMVIPVWFPPGLPAGELVVLQVVTFSGFHKSIFQFLSTFALRATVDNLRVACQP